MKWFLVGGCCAVFLLTGCIDEGLSKIVKRDSNDGKAEVVYPSGPLTQQDIREVQRLLNARGYDAGPADGIMGPRTRSAITAFQRDSGMPVDGAPSWPLLVSLGGTLPTQVASGPSKSAPENGESKSSLLDSRTKVVIPNKTPPGYKEKFMGCVDEANARLRDFGQPEIVVISEEEAKRDNLTTTGLATGAVVAAPMVLPATAVSGALMGGIMFLYDKQASDRDRRIQAETYVTQCVQAAEQQERMREMGRW